MNQLEFKARTKQFALAVLAFCSQLPRGRDTDIMARQLIRAATSVGANYRAACRARSDQEMHAKMSIVEEEADESAFWIELLVDSQNASPDRATPLLREANEIIAMTVASKKTLKARIARSNRQSTIGNRQ